MIMDVIMTTDDLEHTMETARNACCFILLVSILIYIRIRVDKFGRLIRLTESFSWDNLPTRNPETGRITMAGLIGTIAPVGKNLSNSLLTSYFLYTLTQLFMFEKPRLTYNCWYPIDISYGPMFQIIFVSQGMSAVEGTCIFLGFLGVYSLILSMTCAELEKIKLNLINACPQPGSRGESATDDDDDRYKQMKVQLNNCICHHQQILSYIDEIEDKLNPLICAMFFVELATLCFVAFSFVMSLGNYVQCFVATMAYFAMLIQIAVVCWFSSQLSTQMEAIRDAAFGCDWIGAPIPLQKSILLIITRCNKEFYLSAGKFVPVNIKTMSNMIQQSISYLMFLMEMQRRVEKEEND